MEIIEASTPITLKSILYLTDFYKLPSSLSVCHDHRPQLRGGSPCSSRVGIKVPRLHESDIEGCIALGG